MKNIQILLLLALSSFFSCTDDPVTPSNSVTIQGTVFEQATEEAIIEARITVLNTSDFVDTDSTGFFRFDSLNFRENFSLRAEKVGFQDQTISVAFSLDGGTMREVEIPMDLDLSNNQPPEVPTLLSPTNGASDIAVDTFLRWTASDPDPGDEITYDVLFYDEFNPLGQVFTTTDTFLQVTKLKFNHLYFWQVIAKDEVNDPSTSLVSSFKTETFPNEFRIHFVRRDPETSNFVILAAERPDQGIPTDSLRIIQITEPDNSRWRPKLSVQANRVAYISIAGGEHHLFTMNRDGSGHQQVTDSHPLNGIHPLEINYDWSPNGGQLLYPSADKLYLINENGSGLREFATADPGYFFVEVDWSDGNLVAARMQRFDRYASKIVLYNINENGTGTLAQTYISDDIFNCWYAGPVIAQGAFSGKVIFVEEEGCPGGNGLPESARLFAKEVTDNVNSESEFVNGSVIPNTNDLYPCIPPGDDLVMFVNRPSDNSSVGDIYFMLINKMSNDRTLAYRDATMPDWQ